MAKDDANRPHVQQILEASERAAHLTADLLLFSRKQPPAMKPIDLNEAIRKMSKFLARVIGEDIVLKTTLTEWTNQVLADEHQIGQVLMNLAANARDAMPKGGSFTITTKQIHLDEEFTSKHSLGMPGRYALISVSDTGQGMDEETMQRIFEPFFTTKEAGKGTGLGLAVVYGIIKQHAGHINVYSEPNHGTTFSIYLPLTALGTAEEKAMAEEEHPGGGSETILLSEDNESVRNLIVKVLKDSGYTVICAVDGEDAISKYGENKDRIQLLLLDLIMPKKNGKEACDEIRAMTPDIKVLFMSGYAPDIVRQKVLLDDRMPVVNKPITPTELLKKVRETLDR
jgi:CheY-like chemotaxis protein